MFRTEAPHKLFHQAQASNGVSAKLRSYPKGALEYPGLEDVLVCIHVGAPTMVVCQRGGRRLSGTIVPGDIGIIPAQIPARWEINDHNDTTVLLSLPQSVLAATARDLDMDEARISIRDRFQARDPELETLGWSVKRELESGCPSGSMYLEGLTLAVASRLVARHSSVSDRFANDSNGPNGGLDGRRLRRVLAFIEEQLAEDLSLTEIAGVAEISASHLKSVFRVSIGVPVHRYIIQRRVERAKALLMRDGMSMADIAAEAGFAHQSHMARHLRRASGLSPLALKRLLHSVSSTGDDAASTSSVPARHASLELVA